ncbi:MAG: hypothetical protein ACREJ2_05420 [Planctomycetota bacterium]
MLAACSGALPAAEQPPAEPAPIVVPEQLRLDTPPDNGPVLFQAPTDPAQPVAATYVLDTARVRLEFRDGLLHVLVLAGMIRLDLADGRELLILGTGDDVEIAGLTPAEPTPAAKTPPGRSPQPAPPAVATLPIDRTLLALTLLHGDSAAAANHRLRLTRAVALNLRNNGGYPITVNARGRLVRLDEGGSGVSLTADGRLARLPETAHLLPPRRSEDPAAGGISPTALFKP